MASEDTIPQFSSNASFSKEDRVWYREQLYSYIGISKSDNHLSVIKNVTTAEWVTVPTKYLSRSLDVKSSTESTPVITPVFTSTELTQKIDDSCQHLDNAIKEINLATKECVRESHYYELKNAQAGIIRVYSMLKDIKDSEKRRALFDAVAGQSAEEELAAGSDNPWE